MNALSDRLLDFAREHNLGLVADFESLRVDLLEGRHDRAQERIAAWSEALERHVAWEEGQLFRTFEHRCRAEDRVTVEELARDHQVLLQLAHNLSDLLSLDANPASPLIRELLDRVDGLLIEHRVRAEAEVCAPLGHVLDGPTIEGIENALEPEPPASPDAPK